ncbi:hypothetical protein AVEN_114868-1 [Araneus ventricosus]|uniref:Uncharacterized protein n=1 Tax=Araneus ventricosus TaxID=182803 RepID=A0A4Y2TJM6_ARAVE|nr:hypothetical protein AVEN_114868-1 [Araneus ventricosus]
MSHDDRLICCARSRNTSLPSVKRDVRNDRGTRIRPLLSVEEKPLTSRGRKAKLSQLNRDARIDPQVDLSIAHAFEEQFHRSTLISRGVQNINHEFPFAVLAKF